MIISSKIQFDQKINKVENLMIYLNDYLFHQKSNLIQFDPFSTDLIHFDQKINKVENLMIYFNDYFIRNPIWSSLIHFDPFWSILIHSYPFLSILTDLIKSDQKINKVENLLIYLNDYFIRNQIWSTLIHFDPFWSILIKKYIKLRIWWYISMIIHQKSYLIQFDPFWTDLIHFDQKINKVENVMIYFNDQKSNLIKFDPFWSILKIWWYISLIISSEIQFDPVWSSLIQFDPFWSILTDVIKSDQKINKVENLMIYLDDYFIRNQIWSSLIKFWSILDRSHSIWSKKKLKIENLMRHFNDYFIRNWKCGKSGKSEQKDW